MGLLASFFVRFTGVVLLEELQQGTYELQVRNSSFLFSEVMKKRKSVQVVNFLILRAVWWKYYAATYVT